MAEDVTAPRAPQPGSGRKILLMMFLVCFIPAVLAYVAYFTRFFEGRNNFGDLVDPQRDIPALSDARLLGGEPFDVAAIKGKWVLFQVASGRCEDLCQQQLYYQRQIRASTGKEQGRIERVVFLIDDEPIQTLILRQYEDVHFVRVKPEQLDDWLPVPAEDGDTTERRARHVFMADPLGHVMMRFPTPPAGATDSELVVKHWARVRKDISKLLWASKIG